MGGEDLAWQQGSRHRGVAGITGKGIGKMEVEVIAVEILVFVRGFTFLV